MTKKIFLSLMAVLGLLLSAHAQEREITGSVKDHAGAGIVGATEANLLASAAGENHEHTEMYPSFAAVAEKEGFSEIAAVMRNIAVAEAYHEKRFLALAKDIKEGRMFMREKATVWRCRNCGCLIHIKLDCLHTTTSNLFFFLLAGV